MTKKQKDKLNTALIGLLFDWKKEEPLDFERCENMNDDESMVGLLTWLLSSNRVKGVKYYELK